MSALDSNPRPVMAHGRPADTRVGPDACEGCRRRKLAAAQRETGKGTLSSKETVRRRFRILQHVTGILLILSSAVGSYLLATDNSLWLLALSHAVGLIMIVILDAVLGIYSLAFPKSAYLPAMAAALLGFALQLGDVFTAPEYNMTMAYFARYLFGIWAFDLLLVLQLAIILVGIAARPQAQYLARRRTRRGRELEYSRRGFIKAVVGIAGLIGLGVLVGSTKLPAPANPAAQAGSTSQTGIAGGAVANVNSLRVESPVYFEYPQGYPNALIKKADGSLTAVSMLCTHVCCQCSFDPGQKVFYCPCHGSAFDITGNVINRPAVVGIPTIQLRIDGAGNVFPTGISNPGPCQV